MESMSEISETNPNVLQGCVERVSEFEKRLLSAFQDPNLQPKTPSAFAPISAIRKRIDTFESLETSGISRESKLPPVPLPMFDGSDLDNFLKRWNRWLRLCGLKQAPDEAKLDWLIEACTPKVQKLVESVVETESTLHQVLLKIDKLYPKLENDITLRANLENIPQLPPVPEPAQVAQLLVEFDKILARMSSGAMSEQ